MSASHRKLARLPLEIFRDLSEEDPEILRTNICNRLKRFPIKTSSKTTTPISVKTVGGLLQTPKPTLLRVLDPLLTYGEKDRRIFFCLLIVWRLTHAR